MRFGFDGDGGLGDRLVAAVLCGEKTATSSLAVEYLSGEPLPRAGERLALVDSSGTVRGTVETTKATITPLHLIGDDVAIAEGEGFADAAEWRRDHVAFWADVAHLVRADAGDPSWELRDAEPVVVHWFRLVPSAQTTALPLITIDGDSPVPPFEQVRAQLAAQISDHVLVAGTRLPTVRRLADDVGLAVNTVARAYRELEAAGLVETRGRAGTVVTAAGDLAWARLHHAAQEYAALARDLGIHAEEAIDLVRAALNPASPRE
jgi:DNA-binding transcriptional regulator YhcF (GntR family)/uncharacterized protein YhfF